jgi:predicted AlkP superfamily pyrophosphatase or phosphodiesterase
MRWHACYLLILAVLSGNTRLQLIAAPPAGEAPTVAASSVGSGKEQSKQTRHSAAKKPVAAVDRVLIISIDGLRPDLALLAQMPSLRKLCSGGSYTFWAETTPEAYTLPCHVSMLTGASTKKHGVSWNEYIEQSYPNVPTLFEVAKQGRYSTAMISGKMKFIVFTKPGTLDFQYFPPDEPVGDMDVAIQAIGFLREHRPQVMFVHLPGVDTAGHDFGWGSSEQIAAIELADSAVGRILTVDTELKLRDSTLVLLTADHGGAAKAHLMNDPRSHFIPWIASGPGIRKNFDMSSLSRRIRIEDTFATACAFLGLDAGPHNEGKAALEIVETLPDQAATRANAEEQPIAGKVK